MMLLLYGYALSLDVDRVSTLIYDQDNTQASHDLTDEFGDRSTSRSRAWWPTTRPSNGPSTATRC